MIIVMKQNAPLTEIERLEDELREKGFQVTEAAARARSYWDLSEIRRASMSAIS